MATRTLEVRISGDASSLNRALRSTTGSTSKSRAAFSALGRAAKYAGVAIAAGVGLELKRSIDQARESIKVTSQTNAVLKSTGKAAHVSAKGVEELANAISLKAGIDDEAIQSGANILLTFKNIRNEAGKGNKIFSQSTRTITDLSVAMDQPLKNSAIQVGKALNDPITGLTSLTRIGVTFTDQQKKQIAALVESGKRLKAQKIILKELNSEFGGSAAAQADPIDKLKVAWENLEESLGKALLPTLKKGAIALTRFIKQFQAGKGFGGDVKNALKGIFEVVKVLAKGFSALPGPVKSILVALALVAPIAIKVAMAIKVLNLAVLANPWVLLAAAIVVATVLIIKNWDKVKAFLGKVWDWIKGAAAALGKAVSWAAQHGFLGPVYLIISRWKQVKQFLASAWGWIKGAAKTMGQAVLWAAQHGFLGPVALIITRWKDVKNVLTAVWGALKDAARSVGGALVDIFSGAWSKIKSVFQSGKDAIIGFINTIIGVITKIPGVEIGKVGGGGGGRGGIDNTGVQHHPHHGGKHVDSGGHGRARGGAVTRPTVMVGEEAPRHPEWVIATNPAYRRSNMGYWAKAGRDLGVPGFGVGGVIKGAAGAVGGAAKGALGLALKPAKFFIDKLPSPGDYLPKWLLGTGDFMLKKAAAYIKDKVTSPFGGGIAGGSGWIDSHTMAVAQAFAQKFGLSISSGWRSPAHNAAVGGVPNSLHTHGSASNPGAIDFVPPSASALAWAKANIPGLEEAMIHDVGSGMHIHLGFFRKGGKINWPGSLNADQLRTLAHFVHMPNPGLMAQIAQAESMGNPAARGGAGEYGLWQIMPFWGGGSSLLDPLTNARKAKYILGQQGLGAWSTYNDGSYGGFSRGRFSAGFANLLRGKKPKSPVKPKGPPMGAGAGAGVGIIGAPTGTGTSVAVRPAGFASWSKKRKKHWLANHPGGVIGGGGGVTDPFEGDTGEDPAQALADAVAAQAEAMAELTAEIKRQNEFATAVTSVSLREAWRALSDVISGQIAGNLQPIGGTKPAGMAGVARY